MKPDEVRAIRKRRGESQREFAAACGVKQATISRWETGVDEPQGPALIVLQTMADQIRAAKSKAAQKNRAAA